MLVHKTGIIEKAANGDLQFVMSDDTVDRYGDIIEADGWRLANFRKNPIALFSHFPFEPIGKWENVRIEGKKLIGKLVFAAKGTSARIDEIISLVEQGILKAVSVGFRALAYEPIPGSREGGVRYTEMELLECSVVSIPANPAAIALAKQLHISEETQRLAFTGKPAGGEGSGSERTRGVSAASPQLSTRGGNMSSLSARIQATQERLSATRDTLERKLESLSDKPTPEDNTEIASLNEEIEGLQETLGNYQQAEKALAGSIERSIAEGRGPGAGGGTDERTPWNAPQRKAEPMDFMFRAVAARVKAHIEKRSVADVLREMYGDDVTTKNVANLVLRAAVAPADTATPAWAGALVQTAIGDFFELLLPSSVYPGLSAIGGRFGFGRNGSVSLPTRSSTPTVAGSFVGEGAPIPVRKAGFASTVLTPKKMAVITPFTREITERSTPDIEALLRAAIQEDTAVSIDSVLLDNGAATAIRPAGLRNGVTTAAGEAGGGIAAVVADLKGMLGSLITATSGNLRAPVFLMNPVQALALTLIQNNGGEFPFANEVNNNRFRGYPLIQSATVPAGVVIILDAADFFSATGDDPRFDISDQAVLHMEDTTPAQIGTAGTPNVVAAPVQSLFQTDSLALRMILPMSWAMRRTGVVVERTAVTW